MKTLHKQQWYCCSICLIVVEIFFGTQLNILQAITIS